MSTLMLDDLGLEGLRVTDRYILSEDGKEAIPEPDLLKWAKWFESGSRIVRHTQVTKDIRVSTVFLGIDHSFGGGPPLLWETLVFGGPLDGHMNRYSNYADAVNGHEEMLAQVRAQPEEEAL